MKSCKSGFSHDLFLLFFSGLYLLPVRNNWNFINSVCQLQIPVLIGFPLNVGLLKQFD